MSGSSLVRSRREFLKTALAAAALGAVRTADAAAKRLDLLIMGGTGFLGPHIVDAALKRGHAMTLFNRGKTNPTLFPHLEKLQGDRKNDLRALAGRSWDAVIDTSGYLPSDVKRSAELMAPNIGQYLFVSTVSVYAKMDQPGMDETAAVGTIADPTTEKITNESYGPLKALCEQAAESAMPGKTTVIRPGLIVGPGDPTDRFTYWPARVARGGEVLAPGSAADPTQFIDVRDLAQFVVRCLERRSAGIYNADAQAGTLTMGALLDSCTKAAVNRASVVWVPADFLQQQNVAAWADMPIWIPAVGDDAGFGRVSAARAKAAGLTYRPLDVTVRDTLTWIKTWPEDRRAKLRTGLTPERERTVLKAWHERQSA